MVRPRLTVFGYCVIAGIIAAMIIVGFVISNVVSNAKNKSSLEKNVEAEIDNLITISRGIASKLGDSTIKNEVDNFKDKINSANKIDEKQSLAMELANYINGYINDDTASQDELNGARNRVQIAAKKLRG